MTLHELLAAIEAATQGSGLPGSQTIVEVKQRGREPTRVLDVTYGAERGVITVHTLPTVIGDD